LEHPWASLSFALLTMPNLLSSCLCLLDPIVHCMLWMTKCSLTFSFCYLLSSSSLPHPSPRKNSLRLYSNIISLPGALAFFYESTFFCLSHYKTHWTMSVDNVGLIICLLGPRHPMVTLTFLSLGVNRSDPGMSSTTNHRFTWHWDDFMVHG
jgi:hypothetical protein